MFSGRMFHYEYRATTRNRRPFGFCAESDLCSPAQRRLWASSFSRRTSHCSTQDRVILLGRSVFIVTLCLEVLFLVFFVPAFVRGAIADERSRYTFYP